MTAAARLLPRVSRMAGSPEAASPRAKVSPADARHARMIASDAGGIRARALRLVLVFGSLAVAFVGVAGQLVRLGLSDQGAPTVSISRPLAATFSRPDIVDRDGNLLATDVVMHSLYADPSLLIGVRETLEGLETVLPGITTEALAETLANRSRRFVWIKRGLSPATAQKVHDLGLPGLEFKPEPKRSYPQGRFAGHLIGHVNIDNKGTAGIEQYVDRSVGIEQVVGNPASTGRQVRLSLVLPVQAALEAELTAAIAEYGSSGASAVIMDARTGAVRAAASLPETDPSNPIEAQHARYIDRLMRGSYELGSIFKAVTIAMALEKGTVSPQTQFDVRHPIEIGRFRIADRHGPGRPLTVSEIFVHSSNVGAGLIALEAGEKSQRAFLGKLNLLKRIETEAGPTADPLLPSHWGRAEVVTIAYGHGIALSPLQFAAAGATLVNGGYAVQPRFVEPAGGVAASGERIISAKTSAEIRRLMRLNVTLPHGTGVLADVRGYEVGGKTGTADLAADGAYDGEAVVTSFFAAFPSSKPAYVLLTTLHDPSRTGVKQQRTAGANAAPVTARIIARTAPLLGVRPVGQVK